MGLTRKTPLRSASQLKRTPLKSGDSQLKRTGKIKPRSKKTEQVYATERRQLVAELLAEHPWCIACQIYATYDQQPYPIRSTDDVHELVSRARGGSITDRGNLLCVCRRCHTRITVHPAEASLLGLALPSWSTAETLTEAAQVRMLWYFGHRPGRPSWLTEP